LRIRLLKHTTTLAKSKKDAEDEREERKKESLERYEMNQGRTQSYHDDDSEAMTDDELEVAVNDDIETTSVEQYLTYNNPYLNTTPAYRFVANALTTARCHNLLPSSVEDLQCFKDPSPSNHNSYPFVTPTQISEELEKSWRERVKEAATAQRRENDERNRNEQLLSVDAGNQRIEDNSRVLTAEEIMQVNAHKVSNIIEAVKHEFKLNQEQSRCYNFIADHLKSMLLGTQTLQKNGNRCMYLGGPGGTGKSRVIKAIAELFQRLDCKGMLRITATTGIAATAIGGSTIDSLCRLKRSRSNRRKRKNGRDNDESEDESEASIAGSQWSGCRFLIVDEVSMLGCKKLRRISKKLCKIKGCAVPFGGLFVLFSGDFNQLRAVGDKCLYHPISEPSDKITKAQQQQNEGLFLWRGVITQTVLLKQHYRAQNAELHSVLDRIRCGEVKPSDIELLKSRTFGHPNGPDFCNSKWRTAMLVTPRNILRQAWNNQAALRHTMDTGHQIFISPSIDEGLKQSRDAMIWEIDSKTEMLATWNILSINGPATVTANIAVELGVANGSKVIIKEVVPHPTDYQAWRQIEQCQIVELSRPPICVWVELINNVACKEADVYHSQGWFPIMTVKTKVNPPRGAVSSGMFSRTQTPLTPGLY
jgi:PIF1-like helicase